MGTAIFGLTAAGLFYWAGWRQHGATDVWVSSIQAYRNGDPTGGLAGMESAYPLLRTHWRFMNDYGRMLLESGRVQDAIRVLQEVRSYRTQAYLLETLAEAYRQAADLSRSSECARQAAEILPWRLTPRALLVRNAQDKGDRREMLKWATDIAITPMKAPTALGFEFKAQARELIRSIAQDDSPTGPEAAEILSECPSELLPGVKAALLLAKDRRPELARVFRGLDRVGRLSFWFLVANQPESDTVSLSGDFLAEQIQLAGSYRDRLPFQAPLPEDIYLKYVLPYAQLGETRDHWRRELAPRCFEIVRTKATFKEAVEALNNQIFDLFGIRFDSGKAKKLVASPLETIEIGYVHCVTAAILLADACRSVGIPARVVTIERWVGLSGGHAWVEVWYEDSWHLMSAFDRDQMDKVWYRERASKTDPTRPEHRIYAASFERTDWHSWLYGPEVWMTDETPRYNAFQSTAQAAAAQVPPLNSPPAVR